MNPREAAFVVAYPKTLNATQAAIEAGYSAKTAGITGHKLLKRAKIAEAIQQTFDARAERVRLEADDVLRELKSVLQSNVRHFVIQDNGRVELAPDAPPDAWRAVSSVELEVREIPGRGEDDEPIIQRKVKLKLWDKNSAIDKAMRHLGMLKDGAHLTINNNTQNVVVWRFGDREVPFR